ncbi:MAG: glycyl-radical enzyme activating protein [Ignavibacteriales bacterium]|nr:glycyl-radical enzyme activating protein [Ignavibacteriales bacterium]
MKGIIFNIQRYSVNDGPGIRSTVFLKGCPLHCKWCHNPESISLEKELILREDRCIRCGECFLTCNYFAVNNVDGKYITDRGICAHCGRCVEVCFAEARAVVGKEMSVDEVIKEVEKDIIFYNQSGGGVTFSGGEPFLQHEFLIELLRASKQISLHTAVDTSGYFSSEILQMANQYIDLYLYDVKTLDDTIHKMFTGVSNKLIVDNLRRLVEWGKQTIVRVPIIPTINDRLEEIREIGNFIKSLGGIYEIHILPYHKTGVEKYHRLGQQYCMEYAVQPTQDNLNIFADELKKYVPDVKIGG